MNINSVNKWISQFKASALKPKTIRYSLIAILCSSTTSAMAGSVTINESMMDSIFSQSSLNIDIRFNPTQTIENTSLLNLDTQSEFFSLSSLTTSLDTVVNMFFVDEVNWCGSPNTSFIGCSANPGNIVAVESDAAITYGGELEAHELGHALGLDHVSFPNLMRSILDGNTELLSSQIIQILSSPLVQTDANNQRFISINPIAIVAATPPIIPIVDNPPTIPISDPPVIPNPAPPIVVTDQDIVAAPVPLPGAVLFFGSGLFSLFWAGRRKKV